MPGPHLLDESRPVHLLDEPYCACLDEWCPLSWPPPRSKCRRVTWDERATWCPVGTVYSAGRSSRAHAVSVSRTTCYPFPFGFGLAKSFCFGFARFDVETPLTSVCQQQIRSSVWSTLVTVLQEHLVEKLIVHPWLALWPPLQSQAS